jgi:hypothetical protein
MIEWVVERLISLLGPIAAMSKEKRELKDNALRAISTALHETKLYYRGLSIDGNRNLETEAQLSKYWAAAAIPLRHIDQELALACDDKFDYWINPEQWSPTDIKRLGIRLDDVSAAYKKLVAPRFSERRHPADI